MGLFGVRALRYESVMADSADSYIVVLCTTPDAQVGAEIGRGLVERQLAACVNIVPGLRSIYSWQGEVKDDGETQLLIKTRRARFEAVAQWIRDHHPYSEPEIIALPIVAGSSTYLDWISAQTQPL
jgi:periplasmic divalent cation tolerance protein